MIVGNRPHPLLHMLGGLALLVAVAAVGLYLAGWLMVESGPDTATIQLKTREIKQAAEQAVDQGRAVLNDVVEPSDVVQPSDFVQPSGAAPAAPSSDRISPGSASSPEADRTRPIVR